MTISGYFLKRFVFLSHFTRLFFLEKGCGFISIQCSECMVEISIFSGTHLGPYLLLLKLIWNSISFSKRSGLKWTRLLCPTYLMWDMMTGLIFGHAPKRVI
jgi:hypothetical protein